MESFSTRPPKHFVEKREMRSSRANSIYVIGTAIFVAAIASWTVAHFLGIQNPRVERANFGSHFSGPPVLVLGSSLTFFDMSFPNVAKALQRPIEVRSVGAASPCELEPLQQEVAGPAMTLIGVSIFDLNERNLSDAKPLLVPFWRSALDLSQSHSSWSQSKRLLSAYPVQWTRYVFPIAGHSPEIIVAMRDRLIGQTHGAPSAEEQPRMQLTSEDVARPEKITDWSEARLLRRLAEMRRSGVDENSFSGPKSKALDRILRRALERGGTTKLIVLPVSPPYRREFVNANGAALFEGALARVQSEFPKLEVLRLDKSPQLNEPTVFWDLVHLNDEGRHLATAALLVYLSK